MSALQSMKIRFEAYVKENNLPELTPDLLLKELDWGLRIASPKIACLSGEQIQDHHGWVAQFCKTLECVHGEDSVINLLCFKAMASGYALHAADDGEIGQSIINNSVAEVIDILTAVDESSICFKNTVSGQLIRFYLIFGNSPEELIADHTDHPDAELIYQAVIASFTGA